VALYTGCWAIRAARGCAGQCVGQGAGGGAGRTAAGEAPDGVCPYAWACVAAALPVAPGAGEAALPARWPPRALPAAKPVLSGPASASMSGDP